MFNDHVNTLVASVANHYWFVLAVGGISWILSTKYLTPLRKLPGPLFASFSKFPRFFSVLRGRPHEWELEAHRKYGRIVRTGPEQVSVGDPAAINLIYNASDKFVKVCRTTKVSRKSLQNLLTTAQSQFYLPFHIYDEEGMLPDPLVLTDKAMHTRMKRNAYNAYSMGSMLQLEPLLDGVTDRFFTILDKIAESEGEPCDLGKWLRFYATDVIFTVTFGEDLNFMEKGDPIGMMPMLEYIIGDYVAIVSSSPNPGL